MEAPKFLIVDSKTLPEVFLKVIHAKKLLAQGKAKSSSEAARIAGVSRSAYYKYKDSVYTYDKDIGERMVTISLTLEDEPGVLSNVLTQLYQVGANIITVNQNIPVDGVAPVSISAKVSRTNLDDDELIEYMYQIKGVVEARNLSSR